MHSKKTLPSVWGAFNHLPSFFDEANAFFPDIMTYSNETGLSVSENNGQILVEAAVPGLKPENVEISLDKRKGS